MIELLSQVADEPRKARRQFVTKRRQKMENQTAVVEESAREKELKAEQAKADETNKARTGKGTRVRVGQTRGKNPQVISWEAFDESQPDTLPASLAEFMTLSGVEKLTGPGEQEKAIVGYLVDGFNDAQYTAASDPIAEFVNYAWPDDVQKQFRIVVRNYANATGSSLEDAVALIKPGIEKSQATAPKA